MYEEFSTKNLIVAKEVLDLSKKQGALVKLGRYDEAERLKLSINELQNNQKKKRDEKVKLRN